MNNSYIEKCKYNRILDPYCPIVQVGYILSEAEPDPIEREQMLQKVRIFYRIFQIGTNFLPIWLQSQKINWRLPN